VVGVEVERDLELPRRLREALRLQEGEAEVHARGRLDGVVVHEPLPRDRRVVVLAELVERLPEEAEDLRVLRTELERLLERGDRRVGVAAREQLRAPVQVEQELLVEAFHLVAPQPRHGPHRPAL
jgi:hypothetical protein